MYRFLIPLALTILTPILWWPFGVIGIALAVFWRHFILAAVLGLVLDILYGPLPGSHVIQFPFALLAITLMLLYMLGERFVLSRGRGDVL